MSDRKFVMAPERMILDREVVEVIAAHCGDGEGYGDYQDGILFIGTINDDDGREVYGLHIACGECEEEGYSTLVEFDKPVQDFDALRSEFQIYKAERLDAYQEIVNKVSALERQRDALQQLLNERDEQVDELGQQLAASEPKPVENQWRDTERAEWMDGDIEEINEARCQGFEVRVKPAGEPKPVEDAEPVRLTAVAVLRDDDDGGLEARWLLEGGTSELFAGMLLLVADNAPMLCEEDGSAELFTHPAPAGVDLELLAALKEFIAASYPVCTSIDERGYAWSESYLDAVLESASSAIAKVEVKGAPK